MKANLLVLLILGAGFLFARNVPLTVGDVVIFLFFVWFYRWRANREKELRAEDEAHKDTPSAEYQPKSAYGRKQMEEDKKRQAEFNADYKPPTLQDVADLNEWRKSQGYREVSAQELGARVEFPSPTTAKDSTKKPQHESD
jgi:hypothetical protein